MFVKIQHFFGMFKRTIKYFWYITKGRLDMPFKSKTSGIFTIFIDGNSLIKIGKGFRARNELSLRAEKGGSILIGDNVFFNTNVSITALCSIEIEHDVYIANNVVVVDHDHDYKNNFHNYKLKKVHIYPNVWIGANAVILRGSVIEEGCVIGAGAIVKGHIPANSVIVGEKAMII